jgi:hypothetical protein
MTEIIERPMTPEEKAERAEWAAESYDRAVEEVNNLRLQAYQKESDPLFFEFQRGESTEQAWKDKVAEIQARYPFPVKESK